MASRLVRGGLVAQIKMRRTQHVGSFLVVEGKDDMRFWQPRRHDSCRLIYGGGKADVVDGLRRLDEIDYKGVLGLVDSNHDQLFGVPLGSPNLVATDAHDLECLLCRSAALDSVLAEHGDPDKVERFEKRQGADVRNALLERGLVLGRLRWAAQRFEPNIGLEHVRLARFVDEGTWTLDDEGLIREAARPAAVDTQQLQDEITQLPAADPWYVVQGHDLIELLRIGLRRVLGSLSPTIGVAGIARLLRQAMPDQDLQSTGLWQEIRRWEHLNDPFLVLADDRARLGGVGVAVTELGTELKTLTGPH